MGRAGQEVKSSSRERVRTMWERLKATGRAIKHRRLTFALVVALLLVGVVGGLYAIQTGATFPGQTAPGDHEWQSMADVDSQQFCANCHVNVAQDLVDGPHGDTNSCSSCHAPAGDFYGEHAAASAACTDCHTIPDPTGSPPADTKEVSLANDAHFGILADLSETNGAASQTCQSCHTHVAVDVNVVAEQLPLQLNMGG